MKMKHVRTMTALLSITLVLGSLASVLAAVHGLSLNVASGADSSALGQVKSTVVWSDGFEGFAVGASTVPPGGCKSNVPGWCQGSSMGSTAPSGWGGADLDSATAGSHTDGFHRVYDTSTIQVHGGSKAVELLSDERAGCKLGMEARYIDGLVPAGATIKTTDMWIMVPSDWQIGTAPTNRDPIYKFQDLDAGFQLEIDRHSPSSTSYEWRIQMPPNTYELGGLSISEGVWHHLSVVTDMAAGQLTDIIWDSAHPFASRLPFSVGGGTWGATWSITNARMSGSEQECGLELNFQAKTYMDDFSILAGTATGTTSVPTTTSLSSTTVSSTSTTTLTSTTSSTLSAITLPTTITTSSSSTSTVAWNGDFETGTFSQFNNGGTWENCGTPAATYAVVTNNTRSGRYSAEYRKYTGPLGLGSSKPCRDTNSFKLANPLTDWQVTWWMYVPTQPLGDWISFGGSGQYDPWGADSNAARELHLWTSGGTYFQTGTPKITWPFNQWFKLTVEGHANGQLKLYLNDKLVVTAPVGRRVYYMHFGLYVGSNFGTATIYNDDASVTNLSGAPVTVISSATTTPISSTIRTTITLARSASSTTTTTKSSATTTSTILAQPKVSATVVYTSSTTQTIASTETSTTASSIPTVTKTAPGISQPTMTATSTVTVTSESTQTSESHILPLSDWLTCISAAGSALLVLTSRLPMSVLRCSRRFLVSLNAAH